MASPGAPSKAGTVPAAPADLASGGSRAPGGDAPPSGGTDLLALLGELEGLERRAGRLEGRAEALAREHQRARADLLAAREFLDMAPKAQARLEELSRDLFGEIMEEVETTLTHAVREILGQDRKVAGRREVKHGKFFITLEIENEGKTEDVLRGQGGSVCNILSVGLRLIGLARLNAAEHRPFLVLDEQDCWLRPELVPTFTMLIAAICEKLSLQVLYISHHAVDAFHMHASRVFVLAPSREKGVKVSVLARSRDGGAEPPAALTAGGDPEEES